MSDSAETPKIHIDSDWKSQAQAEKEKLKALDQEKKKPASSAGKGAQAGYGDLPPADFEGLLSTLASQALLYLGGIADPRTGRAIVDLEGAKFHIDLLTVLEEKTKGNLSEEEGKKLATFIYELRNRWVQISQMAAEAMMNQGGGGTAGGGPKPGPGMGMTGL